MKPVRRRGWKLVAEGYESYSRNLGVVRLHVWREPSMTVGWRAGDKSGSGATMPEAMKAAEDEMRRQLGRALRLLGGGR
jgi:hypothetical protein